MKLHLILQFLLGLQIKQLQWLFKRKAFMFPLPLVFLLLGTTTGCNESTRSASPVATTCVAGQVLHPTLGCLYQGNCSVGSALYNNQCISLGNGLTGQTCQVGSNYSSTYMTCLPQGNCGVGYGLYNNQCVPLGTSTGGITNCQGTCGAGQVYYPSQGKCFPQGTCYPVNNTCYFFNSSDNYCWPVQ